MVLLLFNRNIGLIPFFNTIIYFYYISTLWIIVSIYMNMFCYKDIIETLQ